MSVRPLDAAMPVRKLPTMRVAESSEALADIDPAVALEKRRADLASAFADELAQLRREAHDQGYEEGYNAAFANVDAIVSTTETKLKAEYAERLNGLSETIGRLKALMNGLDTAHRALFEEVEPIAVEIGFACLTQLLGQADGYRHLLVDLVANAIKQSAERQDCMRILMQSDDAALMREAMKDAPLASRIVEDTSLACGSCLVQAGPHSLDASLMLQVEALRACLARIHKQQENE
jgi:flagellar biosynthesis/type III secretory pathway protein FliH